ncbi:helix-turn-helix domain-containing protein [Thermostaphylospora chromogena]|uniref:Transcriptional regulator, contains XRE-family HTH domain n=1 Tax=Thermostaphylospora chromogena TaxID=35622 RepID=A0A1H1H2F0_9ACTN|nr:helix-turn-helix domain-containing protein [Thermostaphylospora chromogena]SDR19256.1 Transcriptional regulator, contains XRE-family HTH domain [Thermostaphylospora chromogena]
MEGVETLAAEVGARIAELRRRRGWSLSEVARRAGLGKATLSELEAGRRNPTLETLFAVTAAMGFPLSAAIPGPASGDGVIEPSPEVSGRAVDAVLLERFDDADAITEIYRVRIRAGARQVSPAHAPGVREYLIVFSGTAEVGAVDAPFLVTAGEHGGWDASVPHVYAARGGPVEATLVMRYPA